MRSNANDTPAPAPQRAALKVVRNLDFGPAENDLAGEVLEALHERSRLTRAAASGILLGLLAFLFGAHAAIVTLGVTTPSWLGRAFLAGILLLVAAELALIAHALRFPTRERPAAPQVEAQDPLQRRTG